MLSDDELRRIIRRVLLEAVGFSFAQHDGTGWYYDDMGYQHCESDILDAQAAAILREEIDALARKIRAQNWIQSDGELIADPFATVVHTTDY